MKKEPGQAPPYEGVINTAIFLIAVAQMFLLIACVHVVRSSYGLVNMYDTNKEDPAVRDNLVIIDTASKYIVAFLAVTMIGRMALEALRRFRSR